MKDLSRMRIFHNGHDYILFICGDAWMVSDLNMFAYICREKTLLNPEQFTPPYHLVHYVDLPDHIRDIVDIIKDTEYYQPKGGDIYG